MLAGATLLANKYRLLLGTTSKFASRDKSSLKFENTNDFSTSLIRKATLSPIQSLGPKNKKVKKLQSTKYKYLDCYARQS